MTFLGIRQKVVGSSDEIPTNFFFPTKRYRRTGSSEIRRNRSIPTNFRRFRPLESPCFLVVAAPSDNCSPLQSLLENNDQGLSFVKSTSLFVRVKESSVLMSELSQEKTISAMFWCERGIIFGGYISGFVKNPFPTRLTVLVQCFTEHLLKSSQDSRSFSTNSFWPTLPKCIHRPQLATSTSSQFSVSSPNLRLLKLETNSPLKLSFMVKFHQPSS
ncbi:hypothetical protein F2Q68_00045789 [Brassica cretica]|uniref:Uncharacterized protein n=1 Tax=Brassica cretica TaxID=69181 RepID=A0A8S9LQN4_BRACR|nr:hypothetical protein F2Q68_00045789 [Brassica cretica]